MVPKTSNVLRAASVSGGVRGGERPAAGKLLGEEFGAFGPAQRGVVGHLAEPLVELGEHRVVRLGVFADVQGRQVQAEGGDGADRRGEPADGGELDRQLRASEARIRSRSASSSAEPR